jgi:hypothetical protein
MFAYKTNYLDSRARTIQQIPYSFLLIPNTGSTFRNLAQGLLGDLRKLLY